MICSLTTLYSCSFDVLDKFCQPQASSLNSMEYKIQTSLGVSKKTYTSTKTTSIHGISQESGHVGINWVFTSVPIIKVIEKKCDGCQLNSLDRNIQWIKHIIGYVDDKRKYANDRNNIIHSSTLKIFTMPPKTWIHLAFTSGYKLEIDKCAAFVMSWKFTEDRIPIPINNNNISPLIIQSSVENMKRQIKNGTQTLHSNTSTQPDQQVVTQITNSP